MKDDTLEVFFRAQQRRIQRKLETRCGTLDGFEDAPQQMDRGLLQVESRGNPCHATGRRKLDMDSQGGFGGGVTGKRREVTWSNLERKAGRLAAFKKELTDGRDDD